MITGHYVTAAPWKPSLQHPMYATEETYRLAAEWLQDCATVADWGGGTGFFRQFLPATANYRNVDGTAQTSGQVLVDLVHYQEPSDGILLRHVLEVNAEWRTILGNAIVAFQRRMVVVTFTPPAESTVYVRMKSGWPIHHFSPADLAEEMGTMLVRMAAVDTSHPEQMFFLEKA